MKLNRSRYTAALALAAGFFLTGIGESFAQQVNIGGPFNNVGHGFYESIGTRWGLQGPGWFFNFGGPPPAPAFGGFDPNAGAQFGAGFRAGNTTGFFNLNVGQGANSTFVSQTPNITIPNGGNGIFIDGTFRPFVTSIIPVVGDNSDPSPLRERLRRLKSGQEIASQSPGEDTSASEPAPSGGGNNARGSSADRGALSVAAIKAQAAAEDKAAADELAVLLEKDKGAEEAGKPSVARIYYQMAARRTQGEQQREIMARLQALPK
jgi:hypothetical protein